MASTSSNILAINHGNITASSDHHGPAHQKLSMGSSSLPAASPAGESAVISFNSEACPIPFVVHIVLELLLEHKRSIGFSEVEIILKSRGFQNLHIASNKALFDALASNERIHVDFKKRTILYVNPYENVYSIESLLQRINQEGYLTGLRVTEDLLSVHLDVKLWLNELLASRKIRCIRPNNSNLRGKLKCRFSGYNVCDIYSRKKCQECFDNLKDLLVYPLGDSEFEDARLKIDPDVKALWDSITLPSLGSILQHYNIELQLTSFQNELAKTRDKSDKNKKVTRATTKMRRIKNTHLFTAEELRDEIKRSHYNSAWLSNANMNNPPS